jgi:hypothetical protein
VLRVSRSEDGEISCREAASPLAGMTWSADGSFRLTTATGAEHASQRRPLVEIDQPLVAYSIPGPKLLDENLALYEVGWDVGATVQVSGHAVAEEPHRVQLQLILVPRGDQPYHRETVGDRRIDDGQPDLWVVLDRAGDDPLRRAAAARPVIRRFPPVRAEANP